MITNQDLSLRLHGINSLLRTVVKYSISCPASQIENPLYQSLREQLREKYRELDSLDVTLEQWGWILQEEATGLWNALMRYYRDCPDNGDAIEQLKSCMKSKVVELGAVKEIQSSFRYRVWKEMRGLHYLIWILAVSMLLVTCVAFTMGRGMLLFSLVCTVASLWFAAWCSSDPFAGEVRRMRR